MVTKISCKKRNEVDKAMKVEIICSEMHSKDDNRRRKIEQLNNMYKLAGNSGQGAND